MGFIAHGDAQSRLRRCPMFTLKATATYGGACAAPTPRVSQYWHSFRANQNLWVEILPTCTDSNDAIAPLMKIQAAMTVHGLHNKADSADHLFPHPLAPSPATCGR